MRYCCECGNPIEEDKEYDDGFESNDPDAIPIIIFSEPIQYFHVSCFDMMLKEDKISLKHIPSTT